MKFVIIPCLRSQRSISYGLGWHAGTGRIEFWLIRASFIFWLTKMTDGGFSLFSFSAVRDPPPLAGGDFDIGVKVTTFLRLFFLPKRLPTVYKSQANLKKLYSSSATGINNISSFSSSSPPCTRRYKCFILLYNLFQSTLFMLRIIYP